MASKKRAKKTSKKRAKKTSKHRIAEHAPSKGLGGLLKNAHNAELAAIRARHKAAIGQLTSGVSELRSMMASEYRLAMKQYK